MKKILFILIFLVNLVSFAQVGIGTTSPNSAASLDIVSTDSGFLMPRMNTTERMDITSPPAGLQVYDTTTNSIWFYNGTTWFDSSPIKAFGKVRANGNAINIVGATVRRISTGNYEITMNSPMPDSDYIIQLSLKDFNDAGNDDPGIHYYGQNTTRFRVRIQNNDDGGGGGIETNHQFMFTVINQ